MVPSRRNFLNPRLIGTALIASLVVEAGYYLFTSARNFPSEERSASPLPPADLLRSEDPIKPAPQAVKEPVTNETVSNGSPSSQTPPSDTSPVAVLIPAKTLTLYEKMLPRYDQAKLYELQPTRSAQRATLACDTKGRTHLFAEYKGLSKGEIFAVTISDGSFRQKYIVAEAGRSVLRVDAVYVDKEVRIIIPSVRTVAEVKRKADPFIVDSAARQFLADCRPFAMQPNTQVVAALSRLTPRERLLSDVQDRSQRFGYFRTAVTVPIYEEPFFSMYFICGQYEPLFLVKISERNHSVPVSMQLVQTSYAGEVAYQINVQTLVSENKAFWEIGRTGSSLAEVSSVQLNFMETTKDLRPNFSRPPIHAAKIQFDAFAKSIFRSCLYD